ncbi:S-layer homology domain-containing protein [Cohnella cholangitidis]|uniref:S-layer homology domain-containing protein n=1 Tax=Cohnella cholangitidis TaxID=2598458 RepID=A0A7G5BXP3_9BACL|nr:S-layer homology domain-containing protein [Cohnella cholangitidis]QMV41727.1 S-layer homology domain-containing protein [Cohnella cholangitidis]
MRDSSYNFHTQTKQILSRGGEKKVMKKSLSLLLSAALVFGSFGSLAYAADADLTVAQKYQALKDKGILKGTTTGSDGLEDKLNRAQFATIAIALAGLSEEKTGSTFSDVTEKQWWYGAIEAAAKAGLVEGSNGKFDPKGDVTVEQVIVIAARILKLEEVKDAKVEGASAWAAGYIQAAIDSGLIAARTDYTKAATRGQAIEVGYQAYVTANPVAPEKASVASAKATGVKKVSVTLDKAVDTAKATLSLKKGTISVATKTVWADDKKSATLELTDVVIGEGEYTVTLAGLDAAEIATATAKFTGEKEVLKSIEFVNTSDTLARSHNNIVKLKPVNQYGELASANPGSYTVYAGQGNDVFVKLGKDAITGELLLTLDTTIKTDGKKDDETPTAPGSNNGLADRYQPGSGIISVNIFNNENHVSVTKNFKMGTAPFVSKMDISPVKYSNGKDFLGNKGETAVISVNQFDQYGNIVAYDPVKDPQNLRFVLNGYEPAIPNQIYAGDSNNDDIADIKVALSKNVDKSAKYTFNVFNQAGSATGEISLQSGKTANKIEFGDFSSDVAAGDADAYLPVIAYDANGTQLTVDELVNAQNEQRIKISSSINAKLITVGEHKGKVQLTNIPKTPRTVVTVTAIIAEPNVSSNATKQVTIAPARIPSGFKVDDAPKQKIVANANDEFKLIVIDQYGSKLDTLHVLDAAGNVITTTPTASDTVYYVQVTPGTTTGSGLQLTKKTATAITGVATYERSTGSATYAGSLSNYNDGFAFDALNHGVLNSTAKATFTAEIIKSNGTGTAATPVAKISRTIEATTDTLNYTVGAVADLFNAIDSGSVTEAVYNNGSVKLPVATQESPTASKFARSISIEATDAAGNTVAIPDTVKQITSSNVLVAQTGIASNKGYVIGNKPGTATLNVTYTTSKGLQELKTITVNTKDTVITSTKLDRGNGSRTYADYVATPNAFALMNLKVTDNYGITYEGVDAQKYNYLFGVTFTASNVKVQTGGTASNPELQDGGSVTIDQYGNISAAGVYSFELTATSAAGFSASTFVTTPLAP